MYNEINYDRRRFLGTTVMTIAAAELGMFGSANAQPGNLSSADATTNKPGKNTSFGPLKQIDAGVLNVGYVEAGPADGLAVILLHGWPYDIHSFVDVAPLLATAGYRVIVPYLRGYGTTRFLSGETFRNGQPSAWLSTSSPFWMPSRFRSRLLPVSTGARERPISSRRAGRSAARPWSR